MFISELCYQQHVCILLNISVFMSQPGVILLLHKLTPPNKLLLSEYGSSWVKGGRGGFHIEVGSFSLTSVQEAESMAKWKSKQHSAPPDLPPM